MKRVFLRGKPGDFENYLAALRACGAEPVLSMELKAADDCDALLVPGGADVDPIHYGQINTASVGIDPDRDRDEIALIRRFLDLGKPILGICRGHQVINIALGGTLIQDIPGHTQLDGCDRIHPVRALHPFLQDLYGDHFVVNSSHHQAVDRLGEGLTATCVSEEGVIEGLIHTSGKIIGVQYHPERIAFSHRRPDADDGARLFQAFLALI